MSLPVAFWSMPMGGALTVAITLAALRQTALAATSLRISPGAMAPNMIIRPRRFCGHGREENCSHGVGNRFALRLRRAEAGMRNGCADQRRGGVAMQVCMISIMSLWGAQCSMSTAKSTACGLYLSDKCLARVVVIVVLPFVLSHAPLLFRLMLLLTTAVHFRTEL